jgi:NPCBM/NEW2 domain
MPDDRIEMSNVDCRISIWTLGHWSLIGHWGLVIGVLLASFVSRAAAQATWVLTSADFRTERVTLESIDTNHAVVGLGADQRKVELDRVLMLERAGAVAGSQARFVAVLVGNDRACGQPKSIEAENLLWTHPTLGELTLPLKSVMCIVRANQPPAAHSAPQTEDVVTLNNGDSVRGIVAALGAMSVTVQQAGEQATNVPLDSVSRITFATTATARPGLARGYRVGLIDGSAITAATVELGDQKLALALPDGSTRSVPQSSLVSIEHINGPVVWLSSLIPVESLHTPFMDMAWPARMDRTVDNDPIRFGERTYARGIGVHSYSKLTYAIDPSFKTFRTQYAISGDRPYANVTVRIVLDGKVVHEQADVRAATLATPVAIDVDGAKQLALEVDYGQNYDVQDRFNWIEPAFLRFTPTTAPSSQPAQN